MKREGADTQRVEMDAAGFERVERLLHRRRRRAEIDRAEFGRFLGLPFYGARHQPLGGLEFAQQPLHVLDVGPAFLGVTGPFVLGRATGEKGTARRMGPGQRAVRNTVAVDIEIAAEFATLFEHVVGHDLAAVVAARRIPAQRLDQPFVHADIKIEHHEDRRLQPIGEVERIGGEGEGFVRVLREQQHVLGVTVRGISGGDDVGLLGAGRHAGRWAAALNVEDDRWDLGEIGQPDEFLHQRDAGAGGSGKRARAVPARADDQADRGQLVLRLDDRVAAFLAVRVAPVEVQNRFAKPGPRRIPEPLQAQQELEQEGGRVRTSAFQGDARGRSTQLDWEVICRLLEVYPHPDHDVGQSPLIDPGFRENPAQLALPHQEVVRPFATHVHPAGHRARHRHARPRAKSDQGLNVTERSDARDFELFQGPII